MKSGGFVYSQAIRHSPHGPFEVLLDVKHYPSDSLKVRVNGRELTVEGKTSDDDGTNDRSSSRFFSRKWTLPDDVDETGLGSELGRDGVLKITAPRKKIEQSGVIWTNPSDQDHHY